MKATLTPDRSRQCPLALVIRAGTAEAYELRDPSICDLIQCQHFGESFLHRVRLELGRLPPEDRTILISCTTKRLSYAEIASALSLPVDAVARRIADVRESLRSRLFGKQSETIPI